MKYAVIVGLSVLLLINVVQADEISLIDGDKAANQMMVKVAADQEDFTDEEDDEEDDFAEMNDFIRQENDRLKDIKLLTLDLEKSSLELKKKEIEQKLSLLEQSAGVVRSVGSEDDGEVRPTVRLMGVFISALNKEAVLSVNGNQSHVKEGQLLVGMKVVSIKPQLVVVQYADGQVQELNW